VSRPEDRIDNLLRSGRGDPLSFIPITAAVRLAVECAGRFFDDWLEKAWDGEASTGLKSCTVTKQDDITSVRQVRLSLACP
jgi:hypothetical protein